MTVLEGLGGKEGPLMMEIHIFLFSFFPQTGVTRSGNSAQQKALHLFSRGLGGREGPLMAEIYIFCFPIFFPNMSDWVNSSIRPPRVSFNNFELRPDAKLN